MIAIIKNFKNYVYLILILYITSYSASNNQLAVGDKCLPTDISFKHVDSIVLKHFGNENQNGQYYFLGQDFYLVLAANAPRISQGIYVVNSKTGTINQYGGYGCPSLKGIIKGKDNVTYFRLSFSSMHEGNYWEAEQLMHLRYNNVLGCPYLINQNISSKIDASEELEAFCSQPQNQNDPACSDKREWCKTKFKLTDADIDHIISNNPNLNAIKADKLWKVYQKALDMYKKDKENTYKEMDLLEDAGILNIIDQKPQSFSQQQYVSILNDYAFFIYKYGEGHNLLSIDIFDKIIKMCPDRKFTYLNISDALTYLAEYNCDMLLDEEMLKNAKELAAHYLEKYNIMKVNYKATP